MLSFAGDLSSNNVLLNSSTKDQRRFVALVRLKAVPQPASAVRVCDTGSALLHPLRSQAGMLPFWRIP